MEARLHITREDGIDDFVIVECQSIDAAKSDYLGVSFKHYFPLKKKDMVCIVKAVEEVPDEKSL